MVSRDLEKQCVVVFDEAHNIDNVCIEVQAAGPRLRSGQPSLYGPAQQIAVLAHGRPQPGRLTARVLDFIKCMTRTHALVPAHDSLYGCPLAGPQRGHQGADAGRCITQHRQAAQCHRSREGHRRRPAAQRVHPSGVRPAGMLPNKHSQEVFAQRHGHGNIAAAKHLAEHAATHFISQQSALLHSPGVSCVRIFSCNLACQGAAQCAADDVSVPSAGSGHAAQHSAQRGRPWRGQRG